MKTVLKFVAALAAIAGAVYAIATYGDRIVAWAKRLLDVCPCKCDATVQPAARTEEETPAAVSVEEVPTEEEAPAEEAPVVSENEPVAEDADFEA